MASILPRKYGYQVRIRVKGQRLVCRTFLSIQLAQQWAKKTEGEIALGLYHRPTETTVSELLEEYGRHLDPREYRRCRLLKEHFGALWVEKLDSVELARFRDLRLAQGRAVQTIKHDLGLLQRAIKWGNVELGLNAPLPASVRLPELDNRRTRYLTLAEINALLRASKAVNASPVTRASVILTYYTGLRRSELTKFELRVDRLVLHKTKNGDPRAIPLSPRCLLAASVIFSNPPNPTNLSRAFAKAVQRAQIPHAVFHDLRHTAITNLFKKRLTIPEVAAISGHRTWAMLSRYTHLEQIHSG